MSVKYNVTGRKNPQDKTAALKFYANAKADGEVTLKSLSKEISESSTVSDTDVLAVLNDLTKALVRHLSEGEIVRFGDFGSFQITISSDGAETAEKFNSSMIKNGKITFRPGGDLRNMLKTLKFEKYKK